MYKDGVLTISNWTDGIGQSPITGATHIRNCEVFETPGVLKIANIPDNDGVSYGALPIARLKDKYGNIFVLTTASLFKNGTSITGLSGTGYDMCILGDYLFFTHGTQIGTYGPLAGPSVTELDTFTGLTSGYYHKLIVDENPDTTVGSFAVYVTNGNTIKTIRSFVSQASPGSMTTGLTLPDGEYAVTIEKLGSNLVIGTQAGSSYANRSSYRVANIYPWNKSTSYSFNEPVQLNETGVQAMISDNNVLYVVAGDRGNLYRTDGTNYGKIKRIPWVSDRTYGKTMQVYPNAMAFSQDGNLLIGTSTGSDSFDTTYPTRIAKHGVYEMQTSGSFPTVMKYTIANGNYGASQALYIGFLNVEGPDTINMGWQDGSSYGLDQTLSFTYTSYAAIYESPLFKVADRRQRKTFQNLEFTLSECMIAGQGLKISYKKHLADTYTLIGTFDYSTLGAVCSHNTGALMSDLDTVIIKIELTQNGDESNNNLNLLEVKIW